MANKAATYVIDVVTKGLKNARDGLSNIGTNARATADAYASANRAAGGFHQTQAKGVIGTANSTKSFSKLAETVGNGSGGLVGAYATLAANIFAVTAAFNALRNAAQVQQVLEGLSASGARMGLNLEVASSRVKTLSGDLLSSEQAMRSTAQVMSAGFNTKELENITTVAKDVSFALGRNMQDSMDRLTRGIVKLEPELLDELGLMTKLGESSSAYALQLGKSVTSLTSFEKRQGFLNAIVAEGTLKFGDLSKAAGNTTAFDKVAAQFADLTKTIFNTINIAMIPFAALMGTGSTGLIGLMLILGGTISKQLMPNLTNFSEKASKAAASTREMALANAKVIQGNTDLGKSYDAVFKKMEKGTATAATFTKAQAAIQQELADATFLRSVPGQSKKEARDTEADYQRVLKSKEALDRLQAASAKSAVQDTRATGIANVSGGSFLGGLAQLQQSVRDYGNLTDAAGKQTTKFQKTMYGLGTTVQATGAAFLRFLPWIGILTTLAGVVQGIYENSKSAEQKNLEAKTADYKKILADTSKTVAEFNRLQTSTAKISDVTAQGLIMQSNALQQIVQGYNDVQDAKSAAEKSREEGNSSGFFSEMWRQAKEIGKGNMVDLNRELYSGIKMGSPVFKAFGEAVTNDGVKALDKMRQVAPAAYEEVVRLHGGMEAIAKLPLPERIRLAVVMAREINDTYKGAADAVKTLQMNMKNLNDAFSAFYVAAAPSTAYDKIVDNIRLVNNSFIEMRKIMGTKGRDGMDWQKMLTSIGAETNKMLSARTKLDLEDYTATNQRLQVAREELKTNKDLGVQQKFILMEQIDAMVKYLDSRKGVLSAVVTEVWNMEKLMVLAQNQERIGKSQLALEQARMNANARNYEVTAAGVKARFEDEERIAGMQIQQLKTQQAILKQSLAQNVLSRKQQDILREYNDIQKLTALIDQQNHAALMVQKMQQYEQDMKNVFAKDGINQAEQVQLDLQARYIREGQFGYQQLTQKVTEYEGARAKSIENSGIQASITALSNEIATIVAGLSTGAEKAAAIEAKANEILRTRLGTLADQRKQLQETINVERKLAQVRSGRPATLTQELGYMREQYALDVASANQQYTTARNKLTQDRAQAAAEATTTSAQKTAQADTLAYYDNELALLDQGHTIRRDNLRATFELAEAEKLMFDVRKEGLEIQQQSLEAIEKQVSASNELRRANLDNAAIRDRIDQKRRGIADSAALDNAREIKAAMDNYRITVEESKIRKMMIDLEYALLDAQRDLLKEQLRDRKIAMAGRDPVADAQLDASIRNLESVDVKSIASNLKGAIDAGIENSRLSLLETLIPERVGSSMMSAIEGIRRRSIARQQAQELLKNPPVPQTVTAELVVPPALDKRTEAQLAATNSIIASNKTLVDKIDQWIFAVEKALGALPTAMTAAIDTTGSIAATANPGNRGVGNATIDQIWQALKHAESNNRQFNRDGSVVTSKAGAVGIAQIMPKYAGDFAKLAGEKLDLHRLRNDAAYNEKLGRAFFESLIRQFPGQMEKAITAYNAGAGGVRKASRNGGANWKGELKEEARNYFGRVTSYLPRSVYNGSQGAAPAAASTPAPAPTPAPLSADVKAGLNYVPAALAAVNDNAPKAAENLALVAEEVQTIVVSAKDLGPLLDQVTFGTAPTTFLEGIELYQEGIGRLRAGFEALGPQGEMMIGVMDGLANLATQVDINMSKISDAGASMGSRIVAGTEIAQAAVGMMQNVMKSASDARLMGIDQEIAAEQRRDGKSAESVAKIQALEKKKDGIARKSFNMQKKLMMAQAVISTAAAVAGQLASPPVGPWNIALAAAMGAFGAAQLAIIAGTQYQSTSAANFDAKSMPSTLTIGKRGESVDVAKHNQNIGGELGYLRGRQGSGSNSGNYATIGSAYGGPLPRGYGHNAFVVGEKGPEVIERNTPINVRPLENNNDNRPVTANFHISAFDGESVRQMLDARKGDLIDMLRGAANANGSTFLEDVKTSHYKKANGTGASRI